MSESDTQSYNPDLKSINYEKALSSKTQNDVLLIVALIFAVVIVLFIAYFFLVRPPATQISEAELAEGKAISLKEGKSIGFTLLDNAHVLRVNSVSEDMIELTIHSTAILILLIINEEQKVDINADCDYDLSIKLNSIDNGVPNLTIKKISESVPRCQIQ